MQCIKAGEMNRMKLTCVAGSLLFLATAAAIAGPLDPDCTAEKAAKSAAAKATVGVGGRCDPKEAAHDTAKDAAGIGDKDKNKDKGKDKNKGKDKDSKPWSSG
jgi:hypothetical protein